MIHSIQSSRKTKVVVNEKVYSGIPHETCVSCHNRGKRIGVSFQGLMEFPYGSPFNAKGGKQPKLHTKRYLFISDDLHHQYESREGNPKGGLLCQDCHTTTEMHGDGTIPGTTLGQVEIECADCHGTPERFPWEMPLGRGEEHGGKLAKLHGAVGWRELRGAASAGETCALLARLAGLHPGATLDDVDEDAAGPGLVAAMPGKVVRVLVESLQLKGYHHSAAEALQGFRPEDSAAIPALVEALQDRFGADVNVVLEVFPSWSKSILRWCLSQIDHFM